MNNAPLLASLGSAPKTPPKLDMEAENAELMATDDRALDAALEFAALLLDSGVATDSGKPLPVEGGKLLPVTTEALAGELADSALIPDKLQPDAAVEVAAAIAATVLATESAAADGEPALLGRQIAGQIRRAQLAAQAGGANTTAQSQAPLPETTTPQKPVPMAGLVPTNVAIAEQQPASAIAKAPFSLAGIRELAASAGLQESSASNAAPLRAAIPLPTALTDIAGAAPRSLNLDLPMGDQDWSRQFSERVGWVIHARVPNAQLRLNPEHLGPIEMSIEVDDLNARVNFVAAHPLTREAIEQSLPRLREMLEQQGLNLQQADVGGGDSRTSGDAEQALADDHVVLADSNRLGGDDDAPQATTQPVSEAVGLIDTFV